MSIMLCPVDIHLYERVKSFLRENLLREVEHNDFDPIERVNKI